MALVLSLITEKGQIIAAGQVVSTYALWEDLNEAIRPILAEHGFGLSFKVAQEAELVAVTAVLSRRDGHWEKTTLSLPPDVETLNSVLAIGSSVSYSKRYTACALLNITSRGEDDDGRVAGGLITPEQVHELEEQIAEAKVSRKRLPRYLKLESLENGRWEDAKAALRRRLKTGEASNERDHPSGPPEWEQARCGRVTASRVADVIAKTKTGWGAARGSYMGQLLAETLTGQPQDSFVTPAMRWGLECEDRARAAYEYWTDQDVASVGFVPHHSIAMTGASPDGLVGDDGLVEIKCPTTVTHIDTLIGDEVPQKYLP